MKQNRRQFILSSSVFAFGWLLRNSFGFANVTHFETSFDTSEKSPTFDAHFQDKFPYSLPKMPYDYNSIEPIIDKQTMEIHHTKHHQAYVNNLNKVLENQAFKNAPLLELFKKVSTLDKAIRNNGGGHYNHTLYWQMLTSPSSPNNEISPKLKEIISKHFGSVESFTKEFNDKALKVFGSGWCWLILSNNKELKIVTTPNQDNPLMDVVDEKDRGMPLLGVDVWEHAYYLKYQNRRAEYLENIWKVINWKFVEERYNLLSEK
jgi:Fe-Mn family superoxide dismutase